MAKIIAPRSAPRSPRRGDTITRLRALKESNYHNPDTGTEINPEEADEHLHHLEQHSADRAVHAHVSKIMGHKHRSRGRPWIPRDEVVFRNINGHVVPFKKGSGDPWL